MDAVGMEAHDHGIMYMMDRGQADDARIEMDRPLRFGRPFRRAARAALFRCRACTPASTTTFPWARS